MTKAEKEHYAKLARLGCILCRQIDVRNIEDSPTEIHHIRRYGGKRSLAPTIPLCAWHHRLDSHTSIHGLGHKGFERFWGFSEEDLLEKTNQLLNDDN
jgi:hypothetical protein